MDRIDNARLRYIIKNGGGLLEHPQLGEVLITVKPQARNFIARWDLNWLKLTVPPRATAAAILEALDKMAPRLLSRRKVLKYTEGQRIEVPGLTITIGRQSLKPERAVLRYDRNDTQVLVGSLYDFESPETTELVSRSLRVIAYHHAPELLLTRAREIARQLGVSVKSWSISRGTHVLGRCSASGEISLSAACVFLPLELRDYIVCHELAHRAEMNHSPRFHAICNAYLGGNEKALISQLRRFTWPILRR